MASLSVRAIGPRTDLGEGYVTLGAGNRARVDRKPGRGRRRRRRGRSDPTTGAELYRALTGHDPGDAAVLSLARSRRHGPTPTACSTARCPAPWARPSSTPGCPPRSSPTPTAARRLASTSATGRPRLAMMDEAGRVGRRHRRSPDLTVVDPAAPGGRRMDPTAVLDAFDAAWAGRAAAPCWWRCRTWSGPSGTACPPTGPERAAGLAAPLAEADALLGQLLERVDLSRDRVIVVSPAAPGSFGRLTMFAMAGRGIEARAAPAARRPGGTASSPCPTSARPCSTRSAWRCPASMNATPITSAGGPPLRPSTEAAPTGRRRRDRPLPGPHRRARSASSTSSSRSSTYGLAALALWPAGDRRRWRRSWASPRSLILATPPVAFLSGLFRYDRPRAGPVRRGGLRRRGRRRADRPLHAAGATTSSPPSRLVALNWLLQVVDVVLGGRLQLEHAVRVLADRGRPLPGPGQPGLRRPRRQRHRGGDRARSGCAGRRGRRTRQLSDVTPRRLPGLGGRRARSHLRRRRLPGLRRRRRRCPGPVPGLRAGRRSCSPGGGSASGKVLAVVGAVRWSPCSARWPPSTCPGRSETAPTSAGSRSGSPTGTPASCWSASCGPTCRSSPRACGRGWSRSAWLSWPSWRCGGTGYLHRLQRRVPGVRACLLGRPGRRRARLRLQRLRRGRAGDDVRHRAALGDLAAPGDRGVAP